MKIFKLILLATIPLLVWCCKTAQPTGPGTVGTSVLGVARALDTTYGKFFELAKSNPGKTPQQIVVMTANWIKTQPDVQDAHWLDSSIIEIKMKSGLRTTFMINLMDKDSISISRGGASRIAKGHKARPETSKNIISNKNILIYSPYGACGNGSKGNFYTPEEMLALLNAFNNAGKDFNVTLLRCANSTVSAIETFGDYGLVLIDTHGLPDGFLSGNIILGLSDLRGDSTDAAVKDALERDDHNGGLGEGGYDKVLKGLFRFAAVYDIGNIQDWQSFLDIKTDRPIVYRILVNSEFINTLPSMPNTVIVGNMCYSGWSTPGTVHYPNGGEADVSQPIQTAFMNRDLISYYSYGYEDGTSATVGNLFASIMEDSLIQALAVNDDSTGNAYLKSTGQEFKGQQFGDEIHPDMPLQHSGADDYSFPDCIKEFTDARDQQKYKAVCIGTQNWMAENLNYNAPGSCYADDGVNCVTYGKLYDWNTMMAGAGPSSAVPSKVQGICPQGWHIPSLSEWQQLIDVAQATNGGHFPGDALRATALWKSATVGGNDTVGFRGLPGGKFTAAGTYNNLFEIGNFWSTTKDVNGDPNYVWLYYLAGDVPISASHGAEKMSCRCLKDK